MSTVRLRDVGFYFHALTVFDSLRLNLSRTNEGSLREGAITEGNNTRVRSLSGKIKTSGIGSHLGGTAAELVCIPTDLTGAFVPR